MFKKHWFENRSFKRFVILAILVACLYVIRSILGLLLITFIFTFLMDRLQTIITSRINRVIPIDYRMTVIFLYATLAIGLIAGIYKYFPVIVIEISQIVRQVTTFYSQPQDSEMVKYLVDTLKKIELTAYIETGFDFLYKYLTNIGKWGMQIFLALILSLFFQLEKQRVNQFIRQVKTSKLSVFYYEIEYFAKRFVRSFGKVIEVQFLIATINCTLSVIALWILGFPQLFALGLMIFVLGLIPVAGVIISLIPLSTIAYSIGGVMKVVYVLIVIAVIHALESYILNPKLMSSKVNLPVFFTFIVLIFCEHFFGVWGLIVGIPMFMFLLDILDVSKPPTETQDEGQAATKL